MLNIYIYKIILICLLAIQSCTFTGHSFTTKFFNNEETVEIVKNENINLHFSMRTYDDKNYYSRFWLKNTNPNSPIQKVDSVIVTINNKIASKNIFVTYKPYKKINYQNIDTLNIFNSIINSTNSVEFESLFNKKDINKRAKIYLKIVYTRNNKKHSLEKKFKMFRKRNYKFFLVVC